MASYLQRDFTSTPTNADKFTLSFWVKMDQVMTGQVPFSNTNTAGQGIWVELRSDGTLGFIDYNAGSTVWNIETRRLLRDTTSWYHIVINGDSTQATDTNRLKIYINGVLETNLVTTYATQNTDFQWNKEMSGTSNGWKIGESHTTGSSRFTGNLAHIHNIDGLQYAPTVFGETDSTTGEWVPILSPSVTYGTNGWFLKFENSGALGTDSSGNSATFTVSGDLKQSISTLSNNFATFDENQSYNFDIIMAGTGISSSSGAWNSTNINYAMKKGKWYAEFKAVSGTYRGIGFFRYGGEYCADMTHESVNSGKYPEGYFYKADQKQLANNDSETTYAAWSAIDDGDILMLALDLDNGKAWYGVNGTWNDLGSGVGVPNTGAYPHHTFTVATTSNFWGVSAGGHTSPVIHANFGEGRFGTTAVSSGVADNNGKGTFEYTPPAGFYSICTKNIKEYA